VSICGHNADADWPQLVVITHLGRLQVYAVDEIDLPLVRVYCVRRAVDNHTECHRARRRSRPFLSRSQSSRSDFTATVRLTGPLMRFRQNDRGHGDRREGDREWEDGGINVCPNQKQASSIGADKQ
jgi:hypothetical protein